LAVAKPKDEPEAFGLCDIADVMGRRKGCALMTDGVLTAWLRAAVAVERFEREDRVVVVATDEFLMGPGFRMTAADPLKEDARPIAGTVGLMVPGPILFRASAFTVGLDAETTVEEADVAGREVRPVVFGLAADEATDEARWAATGLGLETDIGAIPIPSIRVFVAFVAERAFKEGLLDKVGRAFFARDSFCIVNGS
jgi:hypothetical protein